MTLPKNYITWDTANQPMIDETVSKKGGKKDIWVD